MAGYYLVLASLVHCVATPVDSLVVCATANEDCEALQVVRVYDMKGDFATAKPALTRVPLKETPLRAMFLGGRDSIAACTAGLGQVANLFTVKGVYQGRAIPTPVKVAERLHDDSEVAKSCSVPTSPGGVALLATLTKTKEAKVTAGDGTTLTTVLPSGINNYQVRNKLHFACEAGLRLLDVQRLAMNALPRH